MRGAVIPLRTDGAELRGINRGVTVTHSRILLTFTFLKRHYVYNLHVVPIYQICYRRLLARISFPLSGFQVLIAGLVGG